MGGKIFRVDKIALTILTLALPHTTHDAPAASFDHRSAARERDSGTDMAAKAKETPDEEAEVAEGSEQAAAPKRKLPLRLIAMIAGGLVLIGGVSYGGYAMLGHKHQAEGPLPP